MFVDSNGIHSQCRKSRSRARMKISALPASHVSTKTLRSVTPSSLEICPNSDLKLERVARDHHLLDMARATLANPSSLAFLRFTALSWTHPFQPIMVFIGNFSIQLEQQNIVDLNNCHLKARNTHPDILSKSRKPVDALMLLIR